MKLESKKLIIYIAILYWQDSGKFIGFSRNTLIISGVMYRN